MATTKDDERREFWETYRPQSSTPAGGVRSLNHESGTARLCDCCVSTLP
ncbi:hypothetical protein OG427_06930 [Streptomyces sp. NBC_00133]